MRILIASSEAHPYSKTGGLADMAGALSKSLAVEGHQVGLVTPLYAGIRQKFPKIEKFDWKFNLPLGDRYVEGGVWTLHPSSGLTVYFIDCPEFYQRPELYQDDGEDYPDNAARFVFFCKAITNLARYLPWQPEMVHLHDWQTGLVPLMILHQRIQEGWAAAPRTCLTIHNLAFQGNFPAPQYALTNLPWEYYHHAGVEFWGQMSLLKAALSNAYILTTVSPRYAKEITTIEFGCGMEGILLERQHLLKGILNGVDYDEWKTVRNPALAKSYSVNQLDGKKANKAALQKEMNLPVKDNVPLFGNIGRLSEQKGIDIMIGALEELLPNHSMQFVGLGRGSKILESALTGLAAKYPDKMAVKIGYLEGLPHRIEAGCDFYIMPSRFEPCGLNQMYSLRYGTIPIVRAVGGLDNSVVDLTEDIQLADGFKFVEYSALNLSKSIQKALVLYEAPLIFKHYRINGMKADFSWKKTAAAFLVFYQTAFSKPAEATIPDDSQADKID
jgi:starch synthase